MSTDEIKLKPCPYCGGRAYFAETFNKTHIKCHHESFCGIKPDGWLNSNKSLEKQIQDWNMRFNDDIMQIAFDVIKNKKKWGDNWERKYKLLKAGYDDEEVQEKINIIMNSERR